MSERIKKAQQRYNLEFGASMALYLAVLFAAKWISKGMAPGPLLTVLALAPIVPLALACGAFFRFFASTDERERRIIANSAAVALVAGIFAALTLGFLESFGVIHLDEAMIWAGPFLILIWGGIRCITHFRDR